MARLLKWALNTMDRREPDLIIGGKDDPYLLRWWITPWSGLYRDVPEEQRTLWQRFVRALPNVYLHKFLRSDDDRALHDHPWVFNCSALIDGGYIEHTPEGEFLRVPGDWYFRWGRAIHRVELLKNYTIRNTLTHTPAPCLTLFMTGFAAPFRDWGFYCPKGFVPWRKFTETRNSVSTIGRGCE